jgi:hypothetical protein
MPGDVSRRYRGPKDGRVPSWMLRGGPGYDYPCNNPDMIECAESECQRLERCRLPAADGQIDE